MCPHSVSEYSSQNNVAQTTADVLTENIQIKSSSQSLYVSQSRKPLQVDHTKDSLLKLRIDLKCETRNLGRTQLCSTTKNVCRLWHVNLFIPCIIKILTTFNKIKPERSNKNTIPFIVQHLVYLPHSYIVIVSINMPIFFT